MAMRALLCQGSLNAKSLIESLLNAPRCTPSMLLLPQAPQKDIEFKIFKGFRPSITAILYPFCRLKLSRIQTSIFHWQRFGTAWLKVLELPRLDLVKAATNA